MEEVFVSGLFFVFNTRKTLRHQSEWFTLLGMSEVSTVLSFLHGVGFMCITTLPSGFLTYEITKFIIFNLKMFFHD